jgi:hypothetical protein
MKNSRAYSSLICLTIATFIAPPHRSATAAEWLTLPSTYTHSPATGERIHQYGQVEAPPIVDQSRRITSGYTHFRSTIQFGQSADNYHRVDEWGPPVRPYGEWRFPYRPYSVPYSEWGAPFAGLNLGFGFPGIGFPGHGHPGHGHPGGGYPGGGIPGQPYQPYPANPNGPYPVPPWYDGYHPDYPVQQPLNDRDFFRSPTDRN